MRAIANDALGRDLDVTGTVVALSGGEDATTVIDLAGVAVLVDGVPGATPPRITRGSRVLVLGASDDTGTVTPPLVFAFSSHEDGTGEGDG